MPHGERTIIISASPADVFAFFTTPYNDPRWRCQRRLKMDPFATPLRRDGIRRWPTDLDPDLAYLPVAGGERPEARKARSRRHVFTTGGTSSLAAPGRRATCDGVVPVATTCIPEKLVCFIHQPGDVPLAHPTTISGPQATLAATLKTLG